MPTDGATGFNGELKLGSEGRVEFDSPPGIYGVRVREDSKKPRHWQADRFYRVDNEGPSPQIISIKLREAPNVPSGKTSLSARE
jgi:hypothetical protein